jgi:hypothetical protein
MVPSTPSYPIRLIGVVRRLKADVKITVPRWLLISIRDQEQLVSRHQVMVSRMKYDRESAGALSHLRFGYGLAVSTEIRCSTMAGMARRCGIGGHRSV